MPRRWLIIVAVAVLTGTRAGAAYLPLLGPGPLRFQRPARAEATVQNAVAVPPQGVESVPSLPPGPTNAVVMTVPPEPPLAVVGEEVSTHRAPVPRTVDPAPVPVEAGATNSAPAAAVAPAAPSEPEITPQMLVQYFKMPSPTGGTNTSGIVVTLPLFQPPQPGRIPPSSARYETPPASRPAQ